MLIDRLHGAAGARGIARCGENGPALCDRIDAAFRVVNRSERRAIVEVGTAVPRPIPRRSLHRVGVGIRALPATSRYIAVMSRVGMPSKATQGRDEKPGEPHAFALALGPHAVHAVVPVAASDKRKAMWPNRARAIERAHAVLVQRRRLVARVRLLIRFLLS